MNSKAFISDPGQLVQHMCLSLARQSPSLKYDQVQNVLFRSSISHEEKVSIVSGGGSGHEPAHAGYVGQGMLDAAICGKVFASPNFAQIMAGLHHVATPRGVLMIVKGYTGDKLNFGLAAEVFSAETGIPVKIVIVGDDVSIPRSRGKMVGRRSLAGTVLVHKAAGAAAARGYSLDEVVEVSKHVADSIGTIGCSLDYCHVPDTRKDQSIPNNTVGLGTGIHNEPGSKEISPQPDIKTLVSSMMEVLLDRHNAEHGFLKLGDSKEIVLMVNNLGGLSVLELQAIANVVLECLVVEYQIRPVRIYVNTFLSALDAPGFSVTIGNFAQSQNLSLTVDLLSLLDDRTDAPNWVAVQPIKPRSAEDILVDSDDKPRRSGSDLTIPCDIKLLTTILRNILAQVKLDEPKITEYDQLMGDGDCGTTLLAGAQAAYTALAGSNDLCSLSHGLLQLSSGTRNAMGGTSGALYGIFLSSFASSVQKLYAETSTINLELFAKSAECALKNLEGYTTARQNSRTLMDGLIPYVSELSRLSSSSGHDTRSVLECALKAAEEGIEATRWMQSSFGRSTYVGAASDESFPTHGIPDPGACGIGSIARGILASLQ